MIIIKILGYILLVIILLGIIVYPDYIWNDYTLEEKKDLKK